jgi:hypothetical protein
MQKTKNLDTKSRAKSIEKSPDQALCPCCRLKEQFQVSDHNAGYQALAAELERIAADTDSNGRQRAGKSLNVILHFLMHGPGSQIALFYLSPIWSLAAALEDLESGAVAPMLKPKKINNRPPELDAYRFLKRGAVTVCTLLMKTGLTLPAAAKAVSKALNAAGLPQNSGRPLTHKTILNWRARYASDPDEYIDADNFEEDLKSTPLGELREQLLLRLTEDVRHNCLDHSAS